MIPLAVTSTKGWIRRIGKKWTMLHRLIYVTAIAGVVHYIWLVKKDEAKPFMWAFVLSILLLWRIGIWLVKRQKMPPPIPGYPISFLSTLNFFSAGLSEFWHNCATARFLPRSCQ